MVIASVLVPKKAEVVKKNPYLIPDTRVTWVCPNQPHFFFFTLTQKLHCRSYCIKLQLPSDQGWGASVFMLMSASSIFQTWKKALETKG